MLIAVGILQLVITGTEDREVFGIFFRNNNEEVPGITDAPPTLRPSVHALLTGAVVVAS